MTQENILSQIKNNLEWLEIDTSGRTWMSIIKELENNFEEDTSIVVETLLLIKLFLEKEGEKNENK